MKQAVILLVFFFLTMSCQNNAYRKTNKQYKKQAKAYGKAIAETNLQDTLNVIDLRKWVGTTNFNLRKPNLVIIHHTAQNSCDQTLRTFTLPRTKVSAHYVICKDGTVHHMLNDYLRAWHAGIGKWGNINDVNSSSVGIEIDNNGKEPFTEAQMLSLEQVLEHLKRAFNIPAANFIGHADIAPTRKVDPNVNFDWKRISEKGYGLWYLDTSGVNLPQGFQALQALRLIGYDTSDSLAVTSVFKRKYLNREDKEPLGNSDLKVLYALSQRTLSDE